MKKTNRKNKWKLLIIVIWILFLAAANVVCYNLQKANVYKKAKIEQADQEKIISRQFSILVDTNFYSRSVLYDRLISEVKALSFALEDYDDIEQAGDFLKDLKDTTEIKNLWIYDRDGKMVYGSGGAPVNPIEPAAIPAYLDAKEYEAIESTFNEDERYMTVTYLLDDDRNSLLWGVKDKWLIYVDDVFSDTLRDAVGFFDWEKVLQDITIGRDGSVLAVSEKNGTVLSYSDPDASGKPVEDLHIKIAGKDEVLSAGRLLEEFSQNGEVKLIELNSLRYYASRMNLDEDLFLVMFPAEKIENEVISETLVLMLPMALITMIGILYVFCLAAGNSEQSQDNDEKKAGSLIPLGKLKVYALLAVLLIFVLSLYLETHLECFRMFQYTSTTAEDVMQKKNDSDKMLEEIQNWMGKGKLEKCRIARCILQHADQGRVDRQYVSDLADSLNVNSVYVFDKEGKTSVTNAPYDGRVLDKESPFHALLEGTESVIPQPDSEDASGEGQREVGVMMVDENNLVSGAVVIEEDSDTSIPDDLSYDAVFQRVFLKDNTVVIAVDSENMKVRYFARVDGSFLVSDQLSYDYSETDIAALGLDEKIIRDHFNGELFAINNQYFASIRRDDNAFLMVLRPLVFIDFVSFLSVLYATAGTQLFFILLILVVGKLKMVPAEASEAEEKQAEAHQKQMNSKSETEKVRDEDDVKTLLESLTNRNKPYFEERWPTDGKKWSAKTPMEKFSTTVKLICILTLALVVLHVVVAGENSIFYYTFASEWSSGINLYNITSCIIEIILLVLLKEVIHKVLYLIARAVQSKGETICHLLNSFTGYILFIVGVFLILQTFGVDLAAMSLTAGVAGIIFGIGCQNIVADILAGIIMTFEGVVSAGDFVSFNGQFGVVQSIGVRTTKLKWYSEITNVRNNEFKNFVNMPSNDIDRVVVYLCIDLKESLSRVESIINKELPQIQEHLCETMRENIKCPHYRGVQSIEDSGIKLSFAVFCKGMHYGWVKRLLSRELLLMCERNGIRLAMPQVVINEREKFSQDKPKAAELCEKKENQE